MTFSLYDASSPVFIRGLKALSALLDKALEQGFDRPFPSSLPPIERAPTFALVGRGALPTRCAEPSLRSVVRCEALAARSAKLPYAWMAGLAPTMDGASSRSCRCSRRWIFARIQ